MQLHVSYRGEQLFISFTPRLDYPRGGDRCTLSVWVDLGAGLDAIERIEILCFGRKLKP
jgi:hypothetical protein